jgi:simple sugar transport system ATP-binding protein
MYSGRILAIVSPDTPREEIGLLMAGITGAAVDAQTEVIELAPPAGAVSVEPAGGDDGGPEDVADEAAVDDADPADETGTAGDVEKGTK